MPAIIDNLKFIESDYSPSSELCMYDLCRPDQITKRKEFDWRERACTMIAEVAAAGDVIASEKEKKCWGGMWKKVLRVKNLLHFNISRPSVSLSRRRRWWCRAIIIMIMAIARLSVVWRLRAFLIQFFIKAALPTLGQREEKSAIKKTHSKWKKKKQLASDLENHLSFFLHTKHRVYVYIEVEAKNLFAVLNERRKISQWKEKKMKMKEKIVLFKKQHHRDRVEREAGLFREKL